MADSLVSKGRIFMNRNLKLRTLVLLAAVALAVPAFAKPTTTTITIAKSAKIGKADLQAGEYKLMIDGNKATVEKGKNVVAESEGRWEDRDTKASYDTVLLGADGRVKEVRFSGKTKVFVFND
jgi:hypothetical protein